MFNINGLCFLICSSILLSSCASIDTTNESKFYDEPEMIRTSDILGEDIPTDNTIEKGINCANFISEQIEEIGFSSFRDYKSRAKINHVNKLFSKLLSSNTYVRNCDVGTLVVLSDSDSLSGNGGIHNTIIIKDYHLYSRYVDMMFNGNNQHVLQLPLEYKHVLFYETDPKLFEIVINKIEENSHLANENSAIGNFIDSVNIMDLFSCSDEYNFTNKKKCLITTSNEKYEDDIKSIAINRSDGNYKQSLTIKFNRLLKVSIKNPKQIDDLSMYEFLIYSPFEPYNFSIEGLEKSKYVLTDLADQLAMMYVLKSSTPQGMLIKDSDKQWIQELFTSLKRNGVDISRDCKKALSTKSFKIYSGTSYLLVSSRVGDVFDIFGD